MIFPSPAGRGSTTWQTLIPTTGRGSENNWFYFRLPNEKRGCTVSQWRKVLYGFPMKKGVVRARNEKSGCGVVRLPNEKRDEKRGCTASQWKKGLYGFPMALIRDVTAKEREIHSSIIVLLDVRKEATMCIIPVIPISKFTRILTSTGKLFAGEGSLQNNFAWLFFAFWVGESKQSWKGKPQPGGTRLCSHWNWETTRCAKNRRTFK